MKRITFLLAGVALTLGLASYALAAAPAESGWSSAGRIVAMQKCKPGEMMDEKTKKCVKK